MSEADVRRAFLSLGSNLGEREASLAAAREALAALPGTAVVAASRIYETEPQERQDQPAFLNQVVVARHSPRPAGPAARVPAHRARARPAP